MLIRNQMKNQKGMAILELIPISILCVLILSFAYGFFGVIHTGILQSIAARSYAWETFSQRTNVTYFRDIPGSEPVETYKPYGFRAHSITSEKSRQETSPKFHVTERAIAMHVPLAENVVGRDSGTHNDQLNILSARERVGVNPVWIKTIYGICLDNKCGEVTQ